MGEPDGINTSINHGFAKIDTIENILTGQCWFALQVKFYIINFTIVTQCFLKFAQISFYSAQ